MARSNWVKQWGRYWRGRRSRLWAGLAIATTLLCLLQIPSWATLPPLPFPTSIAQTQAEPGKTLYEAGRFAEAATVLEQKAQQLRQQNDPLQLAATLANLALTYQQLGQFDQATQAIAASLQLVNQPSTPTAIRLRAQALDVQGQLLLATGDGEKALAVWQQAELLYRQVQDEAGITKVQINQAQALRSQGFSRRALERLNQISQRLQTQPDSRQKVVALRSLGDTLQLVGDLRQAEATLQQSLDVAERLQLPTETSATLLSLGNAVRAQKNIGDAIADYQQATNTATTPLTRVQAQLNHLSLLIDDRRWVNVQLLLPQILPNLEAVPPSRAGVYARLNFTQALLRLGSADGNEQSQGLRSPNVPSERSRSQSSRAAAQTPASAQLQTTLQRKPLGVQAASPFALIPYPQTLSKLLEGTLKPALQQAKQLNDQRAESYGLGILGAAYEQTEQWQSAIEVTQRALALAQSSSTWDVAYRWQWQLGRLLRQTDKVPEAIAAYDAAIANLKSLRGDLAAVNPDVQFNFRDSVEPIYRQSVELLLQSEGDNPQEKTLEEARKRIEALQLAELDNFFREACLEGKRVLVDDVVDKNNPTTSIIYPIVLRDRAAKTVTIEVIAKIPNQPLKHHTIRNLPEATYNQTITRLQALVQDEFTASNESALKTQAQTIYNWLIAPIEPDLQAPIKAKATGAEKPNSTTKLDAPKVDTLVFVLDDALRNVPMSLLWDGQQYLVEKYGIALSLGLQLFDPKPIAREPLKVLAAGLSTPPPGSPKEFNGLPNVESEIAAISSLGFSTTSLLNQNFTSQALENQINAAPFNVVHLATHGKFSSRAEDTFILAADGPINVTQFDRLLRSRDVVRSEAIQLLVLSACQTATNDNRATLGLAGFAVRAGARSTLASLRDVNDDSTSLLIENFYRELNNPNQTITKAEALRRAQLSLLKGPRRIYQQPQYWAAYVLIGNWL